MTTPTGQISLSQVRLEIYGSSVGQQTLDSTDTRTLAQKGAAGSLSMSELKGKDFVFWTPNANGTYSADGTGVATYSILCSQNATWSYTKVGTGTTSIANNGVADSIGFTITASSADRSGSWTVTSTAGGKTRTYTIQLTAYGDGSTVGVAQQPQQ